MGQSARIKNSEEEVQKGIKEMNVGKGTVDSYMMSRINFFKLRIVDKKLDDISERLKLIETALGLIAQGKSEMICRCGVIGSRDELKFRCSKEREGSIPSSCTSNWLRYPYLEMDDTTKKSRMVGEESHEGRS